MSLLLAFLLGIVLFAVYQSLAYCGCPFNKPPLAEVVYIAFPVTTALIVFAYTSFFSMKFMITDSAVIASMWPFKSTIPFKEIKKVGILSKLPWWIGWGYRLWHREGAVLAYVSRREPSVLIEKKSGRFRRVILTTQNPEDFKKRIEKAMGSK